MNRIQLIRYKVLDRCFRNFVECFGIADLIEKCNKALSYERASETMVSERTNREDIRDIQERYKSFGSDEPESFLAAWSNGSPAIWNN